MSFGPAARPGGAADAACPCGSGATFGECCAPLLAGAPAPTAERLMRSRFTAFHQGDAEHLLRTWHPRTRPDEVTLDPALFWERLEVEKVAESGDTATVGFRAFWRQGAEAGVLAERSRFARRAGRWFYVDGDVR